MPSPDHRSAYHSTASNPHCRDGCCGETLGAIARPGTPTTPPRPRGSALKRRSACSTAARSARRPCRARQSAWPRGCAPAATARGWCTRCGRAATTCSWRGRPTSRRSCLPWRRRRIGAHTPSRARRSWPLRGCRCSRCCRPWRPRRLTTASPAPASSAMARRGQRAGRARRHAGVWRAFRCTRALRTASGRPGSRVLSVDWVLAVEVAACPGAPARDSYLLGVKFPTTRRCR